MKGEMERCCACKKCVVYHMFPVCMLLKRSDSLLTVALHDARRHVASVRRALEPMLQSLLSVRKLTETHYDYKGLRANVSIISVRKLNVTHCEYKSLRANASTITQCQEINCYSL